MICSPLVKVSPSRRQYASVLVEPSGGVFGELTLPGTAEARDRRLAATTKKRRETRMRKWSQRAEERRGEEDGDEVNPERGGR